MPADPNWFYSTLAQSTAAIVGLAGGFLAQRILAQRNDIAQDRRDLRANAQAFLVRAAETKTRAARVADAMRPAIEALEKGPVELTVDDLFSLTHGQGYTAGSANRALPPIDRAEALVLLRDAYAAVCGLRDAIPTALAELAPMLVRLGKLDSGSVTWLDEPVEIPEGLGVEPANFWEWIRLHRGVARQHWQALDGPPGTVDATTARGLGSRLTVLRERLVPASFWWLWATLVGLLTTGLIAPLTYLTAQEGPSKARLIGVFGLLSLAFLGFIGYELVRIRRAGDIRRETF